MRDTERADAWADAMHPEPDEPTPDWYMPVRDAANDNVPSATAATNALLDAFFDPAIGYSHASLFEHSTRGAVGCLHRWAGVHGLEVEQKMLDNGTVVHRVNLASGAFVEVYVLPASMLPLGCR